MKPFGLVCFNKLRFLYTSMIIPEFESAGIQMFSRKLRLCLHKKAKVSFDERIINDGKMAIIVGEDACLKIGKRVYFNEDVMISCKGKVIIGDGCQFGPNVKIFDNNHKYSASTGVSGEHCIGSVNIGDRCWIGSNVVILKGTNIGKHSVIGAGCIISEEIPAYSVVTQGRELKIKRINN